MKLNLFLRDKASTVSKSDNFNLVILNAAVYVVVFEDSCKPEAYYFKTP